MKSTKCNTTFHPFKRGREVKIEGMEKGRKKEKNEGIRKNE